MKYHELMLLSLVVLAALGCEETSGSSESRPGFENSPESNAIITDYVDEVVIPTYEELHQRLADLSDRTEALREEPSDAKLEAAQEAWVAARKPWEESEAYLFGPVDSNGFDPALDSWPVNRTDLDAVLASDDPLTTEYVHNLDPTVYGFHTAEYLLFGVERSRAASELGARELEYVEAVVEGMEVTGRQLLESWTEGLDGGAPYAEVFRTAGSASNRVYPSRGAAGQEIVFGIITILDEVANGKIANPFDEQDVRLVESQFSYNSLTDFHDNILGAENAYLARNPRTGEIATGLSRFVAEMDAPLDERIRGEFVAAFAALAAIPPPFRDAILDPEASDEIEAAQGAILTLTSTFQSDVLPLLGG